VGVNRRAGNDSDVVPCTRLKIEWQRAGFTSAIILAMIALLIGYESISRILNPVPIHFAEAIPVACLGLVVNVASAWLLSGGDHHHGHPHGHGLTLEGQVR
jgi:Co/Zn/Cd efflux system component